MLSYFAQCHQKQQNQFIKRKKKVKQKCEYFFMSEKNMYKTLIYMHDF